MSTLAGQPCVVCGTPTATRCSACATTGVDLFFCSTRHQKLVWSAHRTMCGPGKAHPLVAPPLSGDELQLVLDTSYHDLPVADFSRVLKLPASVASRCARKGKVNLVRVYGAMSDLAPDEDFRSAALQELAAGSTGDAFARVATQRWLATLRRFTWALADFPPGTDRPPALPTVALAAALELAIRPLLASAPLPPLVKSSFQHRLLVVVSVVQLDPTDATLVAESLEQLLDFLTPEMTRLTTQG
ncbi:hypothetical protein DMC30DRAFT_415566 [Rhodotorula diobovata]|uniref:MYND-type domain-containing protein n=1 Tax=Rhodotorula diobovata TaxID=5288 RepID=A0A5C5G011_9BASI|nr:hypothetical protein DMC30DRAFT_415566 [Rhodotorula diobovata]